jgi:hypothetical protein
MASPKKGCASVLAKKRPALSRGLFCVDRIVLVKCQEVGRLPSNLRFKGQSRVRAAGTGLAIWEARRLKKWKENLSPSLKRPT